MVKSSICRFITVVSALLCISTGIAQGATLFDRSYKLLQQRQQHYDPKNYTFVVLGDSRSNDAVFKNVLAKARELNPLLILHLGDYSEKGSIPETDHFLSMAAAGVAGIPFFVVPGNHEEMRIFREKVGPLFFTVDSMRLGLKIVCLNNSAYELGKFQLDYLRGELHKGPATTFVAMHIPPNLGKWGWHTFDKGATELEQTISGSGIQAVFFAHVHLYSEQTVSGIPHIITGGAGAPLVRMFFPGEAVYHFVVVNVRNGRATTKVVKVSG